MPHITYLRPETTNHTVFSPSVFPQLIPSLQTSPNVWPSYWNHNLFTSSYCRIFWDSLNTFDHRSIVCRIWRESANKPMVRLYCFGLLAGQLTSYFYKNCFLSSSPVSIVFPVCLKTVSSAHFNSLCIIICQFESCSRISREWRPVSS